MWRLAVGVLVVARVGLELVGLASLNLAPAGEVNGEWSGLIGAQGEPLALSLWQRWDALWYQRIAEGWYRAGDGTVHFEPLYPLLARIAALVVRPTVLADLVVSSAAFVVAACLLVKVAEPHAGCEGARLALLLAVAFPTGFFLFAPYTESLYLALGLGAFWLGEHDRPWLAGACGFAAGCARTVGGFLVAPLAYAYLARRAQKSERPGLALAAALGPGLGLAVSTAYLRLSTGEQRSMLEVAKPWGDRLSPPWEALPASWSFIWARGGDPPELVNLLGLVGAFALAVVVTKRLPLAYALYVWPYLLLLASRQSAAAPLESVARYLVVLFPLWIALGGLLARRRALAGAWLAIGLMVQVVLFERWVHFGFVG